MTSTNKSENCPSGDIAQGLLATENSDGDSSGSEQNDSGKPKLDMSELMKNPEMVAQLQEQMNSYVGANSGYIESLPAEVKRRLKALKKNQFDIFNVEAEFYQKVREVEYEFQKKYDSFYNKRSDIISGELEPTDSDCDWASDEEDGEEESSIKEIKNDEDEEEEEKSVGMPEFWLTTFKNIEFLNDMIQDSDCEPLKHLIDVKCNLHKLPKNGFDLLFKFSKNEFFKNETLKKSYSLRIGPDRSQGFSYEGPEIISTKGCKIDWYPNKDLTKTTITKNIKDKTTGVKKTVKKVSPADSFFNFFDPPKADDLKDSDDDIEGLLGADFEIGHFISERLIQRAVLYFTGDALSDEEDESDGEEYDEDDDLDDDDDNDDDNDYVPPNKDNCKQQ